MNKKIRIGASVKNTIKDVFDFLKLKYKKKDLTDPNYNYSRPGHPDEFQINGINAVDFLNTRIPDISINEAHEYENMMRNAHQHPMCKSSRSDVLADLESEPQPCGEICPRGWFDEKEVKYN